MKIKYIIMDLSILAAGLGGLGQGIQGMITGQQNKQQQQWNKDMYDIERKDALADWDRQNQYNSPQAQMQRFKDAGLNPNLIYGQSSGTGPAVRSVSHDAYNPKSIMVDTGAIPQAMGMYMDNQVKQAQVDNLRAQKNVIDQDALLRSAQIASTQANTSRTGIGTEQDKLNLDNAQKLQGITLETAAGNLRKLNADIDYTIDNNERQAALSAQSLQEGAERILNYRSQRESNDVQRDQIRTQIDNLRKDTQLKDLDIQLKKMGIMPGDPLWARILGRIIGDPSKVADNIKATGGTLKKLVTDPKGFKKDLDSVNKIFREDYYKNRR